MSKRQPIRVLIVETEQPIRSARNFEILWALFIKELFLVRRQQGYQKERTKEKIKQKIIKSVDIGYRGLAIKIIGIQYKSIQLWNSLYS